MMDGPAAFVLVAGLFGFALGGAGLLLCLVAACGSRHRATALPYLRSGVIGGTIGTGAMTLLLVAVGHRLPTWLIVQWTVLAALAGFAAAVLLDLALGRRRRRPPRHPGTMLS
jgi:hypothetical protein